MILRLHRTKQVAMSCEWYWLAIFSVHAKALGWSSGHDAAARPSWRVANSFAYRNRHHFIIITVIITTITNAITISITNNEWYQS